ncbi:MAG TPA: hypothetical protein VGP63_01030, partial [Planctomycetaceae bacterium]|nr:hypothetical protein [Planctomycetaceae bacterium]
EGGTVRFLMPKLVLLPGCYHFTIFSTVNGEIVDWVKSAGFFYVEGGSFFPTGQLPEHGDGIIATEQEVCFGPPAHLAASGETSTIREMLTVPESTESVSIVS